MDINSGKDSRDHGPRVSPREIEMIRLRDGKVPVEFVLMTDEVIDGLIMWFDETCVHLVLEDKSEVTVFYNVVSMYRRRK